MWLVLLLPVALMVAAMGLGALERVALRAPTPPGARSAHRRALRRWAAARWPALGWVIAGWARWTPHRL